MIDGKGFRKAMKSNQTSVVAFVAPWCGHCQRMAPEYSKAALGLHPLVPLYAVDCDKDSNKALCAEQGVKGFPTVKLFPRGNKLAPVEYNSGERTSSAFFYWVSRNVPNKIKKLLHVEDIPDWVAENTEQPRALLLTKDKKVPLLWQVLGNKYHGQILLASHHDQKGSSSVSLGFEAGAKKQSKVLLYPVGSTSPVRYEGPNKFDALSKFFNSVLDGTADLAFVHEVAKPEEFIPDKEDTVVEQKQEAQAPLAHSDFTDSIDPENTAQKGHGADDHDDAHGYPGKEAPAPLPETPPARASQVPTEVTEQSSETKYDTSMEEASQTVFEATTDPKQEQAASETATTTSSEYTQSADEGHLKDEL